MHCARLCNSSSVNPSHAQPEKRHRHRAQLVLATQMFLQVLNKLQGDGIAKFWFGLSGFKHPDACFSWGFLNVDTSRALGELPELRLWFRDICESDSPAAQLSAHSEPCQSCLNTTGSEKEDHYNVA